ncbi:hypothetical protein [Ruegeria sp. HKCCD7318]|uniref:hypothetical protein n=1 Tax=Ruegeria sp. HKCCD7318 TaxID=2683014 RepID=UPI0014913523|nr:hypothetical protein [Ruegeria sp. HKCCD7318]NOE35316.1 hypothetical protein [Ruegeria sp. HKCCD7318]
MPVDQISALERFLTYRPIGLAALMLVLVIIALTLSELSETRAGLLKIFMGVGAVCFFAILAAQFFEKDGKHNMRVNVLPGNLNEVEHSAPPDLLVDGQSLSSEAIYTVEDDFVVVIDMEPSISTAETALANLEQRFEDQLEIAQEEHSIALERHRLESQKSLQELQEKISIVTIELEKVKAIQGALANLQSNSASTDQLRLTRELEKGFETFLRNVSGVMEQ